MLRFGPSQVRPLAVPRAPRHVRKRYGRDDLIDALSLGQP